MTLDPQINALLEQVAASGTPSPESLSIAENRAAVAQFAQLAGDIESVGEVNDRHADLGDRQVPIRIYTPAGTGTATLRPVTVFLHGGGWVTGDLDSQDQMARIIANRSGSIVVSVGYRLAPEHRFPAAVDDAYQATAWVAAHAHTFGGDGRRLALFGESAGGNLAAVVAQEALRRGGPEIALQVLAYPVVDRFDDSPSMHEHVAGPLLSRAWVEWFWGCYLLSPDDGADVRVSPARSANLTGLPATVVVTAEHDPLRDQGRRYAQLLQDAGVSVTHLPIPGVTHAFLSFTGSVGIARDVLDRLGAAIAAATDERRA